MIDYELLRQQRDSILMFMEHADGILNLMDSILEDSILEDCVDNVQSE